MFSTSTRRRARITTEDTAHGGDWLKDWLKDFMWEYGLDPADLLMEEKENT